jgi:hypothetical protein
MHHARAMCGTPRALGALSAVAIAFALLALFACAGPGGSDPAGDARALSSTTGPAPSSGPAPSPGAVAFGTGPQLPDRVGMEVRSFATLATFARVESVLIALGARETSLRGPAPELLRHARLRAFEIDAARLTDLYATLASAGHELDSAMPGEGDSGGAGGASTARQQANQLGLTRGFIGGVQRLWVDQGPRWVEGVRGVSSPVERAVTMHDGVAVLSPGTMRLLTRCWAQPVIEDAPSAASEPVRASLRLRIELVPQLQDAAPARRALAAELEPALRPAPEEQGVLFRRLLAGATLGPGRALILLTDGAEALPVAIDRIEEDPAIARAPEPPARPGEVARRREAPAPEPGAGLGPPPVREVVVGVLERGVAPPSSVGEELLSFPPTRGRRLAVRTIVALVASLPSESEPPAR